MNYSLINWWLIINCRDSWWYGEYDIYNGVWMWEDSHDLLKERFPHGLEWLHDTLGLPFACHMGKWYPLMIINTIIIDHLTNYCCLGLPIHHTLRMSRMDLWQKRSGPSQLQLTFGITFLLMPLVGVSILSSKITSYVLIFLSEGMKGEVTYIFRMSNWWIWKPPWMTSPLLACGYWTKVITLMTLLLTYYFYLKLMSIKTGKGAYHHGINIEYCMDYTSVLLTSLENPTATHSRAGTNQNNYYYLKKILILK